MTRPAPATLAAEAASAAARRRDQYPALVAAGRIGQSQADDEIRIWTAIAADWAWVAGAASIAADGAGAAEKIAACTDSLRRFDAALAKAISAAPAPVAADCTPGRDLAELRAAHGEAVATILAILAQRDAIEAIRAIYRTEQPFARMAALRAQALAMTAERRAA